MDNINFEFYENKKELQSLFIDYLYEVGVLCEYCTKDKNRVDNLVGQIIGLYNELKEFNEYNFLNDLFLKDKQARDYFILCLENYHIKTVDFKDQINTLRDKGRVYDNSYTQKENIERAMKSIFDFCENDLSKSVIYKFKNASTVSNELNPNYINEPSQKIELERTIYIEKKESKPENKPEIKHPFENAPTQYCIIAQLFATNEITIKNGLFYFKGNTYPNANNLNTAISKYYNKNYTFSQYIRDTADKKGTRNLFDIPDYLKTIKSYFEQYNIEVINKDFKGALKAI